MDRGYRLGMLGALLAGSLAFGAEAYAQQTRPNRIHCRDEEYSASGDGVLLKNFVYGTSSAPGVSDSTLNLNQICGGLYADRGNISYDVIDARKGLENIISYLRARGDSSTEKGRASIAYHRRLSQAIPQTDSASLRAFGRAVADGRISRQEMRGIKPGFYMIIARSSDMPGYSAEAQSILFNNGTRLYTGERPAPVPPAPRVPARRREPTEQRPPVRREPQRERLDTLRREPERERPDTTRRQEPERPDTSRVREPPVAREHPMIRDTARADTARGERPHERPRERPVYRPRQPRRLSPQLGIETEYGVSNDEVTVGVFGNVPLGRQARLGIFGNYSVSEGDSYLLDEPRTEVTERARRLIGPDTYKSRTDVITTSFDDKAIAETGLEFTFVPFNCGCLELPFRAGVKRLRRAETVDGTSTISFERNGQQLGNEEVITNTLENRTFVNRPSFSTGLRVNLGRHAAIEALYNKAGRQNNGKVGARFNF